VDTAVNKITVRGERTSCINGFTREVDVTFEMEGETLAIVNGAVTGHESWTVDPTFVRQVIENGLCACAGTNLRWDSLWIPPADMQKVVNALVEAVDG
jgi:hypothetical protein